MLKRMIFRICSGWRYYLIVFTPVAAIFFIIPFELYYNAQEYWNWNHNIPLYLVQSSLIIYFLLIIFICTCFLISNRLADYLAVCLFCSGIFILLADVFAPLQTNLLAGSELVSQEPLVYSFIELGIFLLIIGVVLKLGLQRSLSLALALSMTLSVVSIGYLLLVLCSSKPTLVDARPQQFKTNIKGNVYHIVLDEMQTDVALEYLKEHDAAKYFSGFTLFKNNISNYLYTEASCPSYLTGTLYERGSFKRWKESFKEKGLLHDLYEKGYRITVYSPGSILIKPYVSKIVTLDDIYA